MSEPTIKPVGMRCPKCRTNTDDVRRSVLDSEPWRHCSFCDVDTEPMFGPDALVVVAKHVRSAGRDMHGDLTTEQIVERLTGVKQ